MVPSRWSNPVIGGACKPTRCERPLDVGGSDRAQQPHGGCSQSDLRVLFDDDRTKRPRCPAPRDQLA